jgi:hypothetical protein
VIAVAKIEELPRDAARMLAVEILLAEPESLGDDVLESCLYILREKLRAMCHERPRWRETAYPYPRPGSG